MGGTGKVFKEHLQRFFQNFVADEVKSLNAG